MKKLSPEILSIGDRIRDGRYRRHSRFDPVINFTDNTRITALVTPDIEAGPNNIVLNFLEGLKADRLIITSHHLKIDEHTLPRHTGLIYDSSLPGREWPDKIPTENLQTMKAVLMSKAPEESLAVLLKDHPLEGLHPGFQTNLMRRFIAGKEALIQGNFQACAGMVKGLGPGLTPAGDDFIAGMLWALHLNEKITGHDHTREKKEIFHVGYSDNLIVQTFLESATEGRFTPTVREVLIALAVGMPDDVKRAVTSLLGVGATSGTDSAVGVFLTVNAMV